jgi:serine/threonine-protein kinase
VERLAAGLAAPLKAILHQSLGREPAERFATASELGQALRAALVGQPQPYGRKEAAEELALLLSEATVIRGQAEFAEAGFFPAMLDAHELDPDTPAPAAD